VVISSIIIQAGLFSLVEAVDSPQINAVAAADCVKLSRNMSYFTIPVI